MILLRTLLLIAIIATTAASLSAGTRTWDGRHDTSEITVTVVYFVPADREPLSDWQDRLDYFRRRIENFHAREFGGQSTLRTVRH
ncbi:MAG: hypothetical protein KDA85_16775 [Planctomycetaceae bacterium]|nr:hypothetical protein [Planctomycetaceae bacterium]